MLDHLDYRDTSPLLIPKGYTRDYLDGKITSQDQRETVMQAFDRINSASEIVLCEGTGHCAVGTIVDASNAAVASWLGSPMVLVANGGLVSYLEIGSVDDNVVSNQPSNDNIGQMH